MITFKTWLEDKREDAAAMARDLHYNRNINMGLAIALAAKEYNVPRREISHILNPPKLEISWKKPNLQEELGEYFENEATKEFMKQHGYTFNTPQKLLDFLKQGELTEIHRRSLTRAQNLTTNPEDFNKELQDPEYRQSYDDMKEHLLKERKISLPTPILLQIGDTYWGFAGNRRMNLAWNYELPVTFWLVKQPDKTPTQKKLF